jgi:Fur family peroxide stress response transcriptional regulator
MEHFRDNRINEKMSRTESDSRKRMARFTDACRKAGVRITPQRLVIFRELTGFASHPDTETIYRRVRKRLPNISLDTVYRTLNLLSEKKLISRVGSISGPARFEANPDPHHHFVCMACGTISDVHVRALGRLRVTDAALQGYAVRSIHVEIRGLCRRCAAKRK